jgi:hypothetical protein
MSDTDKTKSSSFVDKMMKRVLEKSRSHPTRDPVGSYDRDNMPSKPSGDKVASYHLRSVAEFKSRHHRSPTYDEDQQLRREARMHVLKEEDEARRLAKINKATRILTEEEGEDDDDDDKAHRTFEELEEEARQQAEEAARRKAKEEARRKAKEMRCKAFEEARRKEEASRKAEEERRKAIEEASRKAEEERRKVIEEASQKAEEERRKTALAVAMKEATERN